LQVQLQSLFIVIDNLHRLSCSSKHLSYSRRRPSEQDYICDKYAARIYPCTGTQSILVASRQFVRVQHKLGNNISAISRARNYFF